MWKNYKNKHHLKVLVVSYIRPGMSNSSSLSSSSSEKEVPPPVNGTSWAFSGGISILTLLPSIAKHWIRTCWQVINSLQGGLHTFSTSWSRLETCLICWWALSSEIVSMIIRKSFDRSCNFRETFNIGVRSFLHFLHFFTWKKNTIESTYNVHLAFPVDIFHIIMLLLLVSDDLQLAGIQYQKMHLHDRRW